MLRTATGIDASSSYALALRREVTLCQQLVQRLALLAGRQVQHRQLRAEDHVVVRRHPAIPRLATSQASVDDHLLTIAPKGGANRFHQTATFVFAVARRLIDMPRVETQRTMIPLAAPANRRSHERL